MATTDTVMTMLTTRRRIFHWLLGVTIILVIVYVISVNFEENDLQRDFFKRLFKADKQRNIERKRKQKVAIFIGIMSAPRHIFRRNALRRTWFTRCKKHNIPCWFFSDSQDMYARALPEQTAVPLANEQDIHGDLILVDSPGGINFALRYLWMAAWANDRYDFDYFLRVDDDYFICIDRLVSELPFRQKEKLYWGFVKCEPPGGLRVDEGFVIVSNDLLQEFLREQNKTLMCHPYGDQAMAMWINNIPGVTYHGDPRIYDSVAANDPNLRVQGDLCLNYLALHGSYPVQLNAFWNNHVSAPRPWNYSIPGVSYPCGNQNKTYNAASFKGMYHAEPIPCKEKPTWQIGDFYAGRNGLLYR